MQYIHISYTNIRKAAYDFSTVDIWWDSRFLQRRLSSFMRSVMILCRWVDSYYRFWGTYSIRFQDKRRNRGYKENGPHIESGRPEQWIWEYQYIMATSTSGCDKRDRCQEKKWSVGRKTEENKYNLKNRISNRVNRRVRFLPTALCCRCCCLSVGHMSYLVPCITVPLWLSYRRRLNPEAKMYKALQVAVPQTCSAMTEVKRGTVWYLDIWHSCRVWETNDAMLI
jgi:hypothetical protein